jgi:hypothetical protein
LAVPASLGEGNDFCSRQGAENGPSDCIVFAGAESYQHQLRLQRAQACFEPVTPPDLGYYLDRDMVGEYLPNDISEKRRYRHHDSLAYRPPPSVTHPRIVLALRQADQRG